MTTAGWQVSIYPDIMARSTKKPDATELEAELARLNALVRERRKHLASLKNCPNQQCPCRVAWRGVVEKNLSSQLGRIRRKVSPGRGKSARPGQGPHKSG